MLDDAIVRGYETPKVKADKCKHNRFGWEDCIACYDEALSATAAAIRQLGEG